MYLPVTVTFAAVPQSDGSLQLGAVLKDADGAVVFDSGQTTVPATGGTLELTNMGAHATLDVGTGTPPPPPAPAAAKPQGPMPAAAPLKPGQPGFGVPSKK